MAKTDDKNTDAEHVEALDRFKLVAAAEGDQRRRELEDLRFARGYEAGDQWPSEVLTNRGEAVIEGTGYKIPARPTLTINKLEQPLEQIATQYRNANISQTVHPKTAGADDDTAEVIEGWLRQLEYQCGAQQVRGWALERASKCGRGYYRVLKAYAREGTEDDAPDAAHFDQDIQLSRILNQHSVYFDPFAKQVDNSDAEWCFITSDLPLETYKDLYGDSEVTAMSTGDLSALGDSSKTWFGQTQDGQQLVRVAEYFTLNYSERMLVSLGDGKIGWLGDDGFPEKEDDPKIKKRRVIQTPTVKWRVLNGVEWLDEEDWDGAFIPVITVIGKEDYVDGEHSWSGICRSVRDAQRMYNWQVSHLAETIALASKSSFVGYKESFEGLEHFWATANTKNWAFLPANRVPTDGALPNQESLPLPQRVNTEPAIQAVMAAISHFDQDIKTIVGFFDPNLSNISAQGRSGKAVLALQQQAQSGISRYVDNLVKISMVYEAKVLLDLLPRVYDRPGRMLSILGYDQQTRDVLINQPYYEHEGKQIPIQPQPGAPPEAPPVAPQGKKVLHYDLRKGKYTVVLAAGKSYSTMRDEGADRMMQLFEAQPNLPIGDIVFQHQDFPGAKDLSKRLHELLPPQIAQKEDEQQAIPPQVQAQIQQMGAELNQAKQFIATKQAENQSKIEAAKIQMATTLQKTQMDNETKLAVAELSAKMDRMALFLEERSRLGIQQADQQSQMADHSHDVGMAAMQQQHDLQAAQQAHQQALQQGQQGIQGQADLAQQQAALTPPPDQGSGA